MLGTFSMSSARGRRRLARLGLAAAFCGAVGLVVALVPAFSGKTVQRFSDQPVQRARAEREVPLPAVDRRAIGAMLTRFVLDVIERKRPLAGLPLAGAPLRAGTTLAQWAKGDVPVYPYDARGRDFSRSWLVIASYATHVDIELDLQPGRTSPVGPIAFSAVIRKRAGRWQVDSIYPQAIYPR